MGVESVQDRRVDRVDCRRPSEVFLALWRYYALDQGDSASVEDFAKLADVWAQIRELEIRAVSCGRPEPAVADANSGREPCSPRRPPSSLEQGEIENVSESDHTSVILSEAKNLQDPSAAPQDDKGEAAAPQDDSADEEAEAEAKKARSMQSAKGFAGRKRKALARVEAFRAGGGKLAAIVEASDGKLTMDVLLDLIACKPQPVVTWAALEKALNKLGSQKDPSASAQDDTGKEEKA